MIKKLHPVAIAPQNLSTNEQIRAGFQEILVDINSIVVQWNEIIQPLVDSLPGGRRRLTPADRNANVNPIENGCDGSQVFMDMTSTPQILSGFLYNSRAKRPKTIKEVVVDSHISLQSEVSKLRVLVEAIDLADESYDDTNIKNWIRRLAADTISDLDQGDPFGTGYFGEPTKTVQYSLHQRDVNLRTLIGIDEADYGLTNPGFDGTNHIDDMDIIDALIELDSQLTGAVTPTLQIAYDNSTDGGIVLESGKPIFLNPEENSDVSLQVKGRIELIKRTGGEDVPVWTTLTGGDGATTHSLSLMNGSPGDETSDSRFFLYHDSDDDVTSLSIGASSDKSSITGSFWSLGKTLANPDTRLYSFDELYIQVDGAAEDDNLGTLIVKSGKAFYDFAGILTGSGLSELLSAEGLIIRDPNHSSPLAPWAGFVQSLETYNTLDTAGDPVKGVYCFADRFRALGIGPKGYIDGDGEEASPGSDGITPAMNYVYADNIVKAKARILCPVIGTTPTVKSSYNIDVPATETLGKWDDTNGILSLTLLTNPGDHTSDNDDYTVTVSVETEVGVATTPVITQVVKTGTKTFDIYVRKWTGSGWGVPTADLHANFQVV